MQNLKQSTVFTTVVGPIVDTSNAAYASAVIGDLTIWKNGTPAAMAATATLTHLANGLYTLAGTTGNSDTLGRVDVTCNKSGYRMPPARFMVLPAATFIAFVTNAAGGDGGLPTCGEDNGTLNLTGGPINLNLEPLLPLTDEYNRPIAAPEPTHQVLQTSIGTDDQADWTLVNSSFVGSTLVMTATTGTARMSLPIDLMPYRITAVVSCPAGDNEQGGLILNIYDTNGTTVLHNYTLYNGTNVVSFQPKRPYAGGNGLLKIFNNGEAAGTATFSLFLVERAVDLFPDYWAEIKYQRDESGSTSGEYSATWFLGSEPVNINILPITLPKISIYKASNGVGLISEQTMTVATNQTNRFVYVDTPDSALAADEAPAALCSAVIDGQRRECFVTFARDIADA